MLQYALGYVLSKLTGLDLTINTDRFEADELRDLDLGCYKINFVQARQDDIRSMKLF